MRSRAGVFVTPSADWQLVRRSAASAFTVEGKTDRKEHPGPRGVLIQSQAPLPQRSIAAATRGVLREDLRDESIKGLRIRPWLPVAPGHEFQC